jgi:hypothetical protein
VFADTIDRVGMGDDVGIEKENDRRGGGMRTGVSGCGGTERLVVSDQPRTES